MLLDIWAPWCGPCKALGPVLEKLETAYTGRFVLAKLNSDEQPEIAGQLSQMFGVRSIPFCVLFKDGQPVDGFVGALPESEVRAFLDKHVASAEQVAAEQDVVQAKALLEDGDIDSALEKLQEAVAINPGDASARYEYLHALLSAGRVAEARRAYDPVSTSVVPDLRIAACGHWLAACESAQSARPVAELEAIVVADKRNFDARFELAQQHFAARRFPQAMDEFLEILMRDKTWREGLARKACVALLEVMTEPKAGPAKGVSTRETSIELPGKQPIAARNPLVDSYRRRLSMVMF
ncbi:MAG: tetratricopeptide repeat protein [Burkholderiales bacterium]